MKSFSPGSPQAIPFVNGVEEILADVSLSAHEHACVLLNAHVCLYTQMASKIIYNAYSAVCFFRPTVLHGLNPISTDIYLIFFLQLCSTPSMAVLWFVHHSPLCGLSVVFEFSLL